jgi:peptide subunit release factor 1 (eRF1)
LQGELKTAGNIKDKGTRKNVEEALRSLVAKVRDMTRDHKLPPTGLALFAGHP